MLFFLLDAKLNKPLTVNVFKVLGYLVEKENTEGWRDVLFSGAIVFLSFIQLIMSNAYGLALGAEGLPSFCKVDTHVFIEVTIWKENEIS